MERSKAETETEDRVQDARRDDPLAAIIRDVRALRVPSDAALAKAFRALDAGRVAAEEELLGEIAALRNAFLIELAAIVAADDIETRNPFVQEGYPALLDRLRANGQEKERRNS